MGFRETREKILQALVRLHEQHGRAISPREIADEVGLDLQTVSDYFEALEEAKYVKLITWHGGDKVSHAAEPTGQGRLHARSLDTAETPDEQLNVIASKKRRLRLLEEQQARKGDNTLPEVVMEIEDRRQEIEKSDGLR